MMRNEKNAGSGAIEFAQELTEGLDEYERIDIEEMLFCGILPVEPAKRVKTCNHCGYFYRDKTRNNSSKTCSRECKISRDTDRRRDKLNEAREHEPSLRPRLTNKQEYYYEHYEYSFWLEHERMDRHHWNYERPHGNLADIQAARECYEIIGGRRRHASERSIDYYEGDDF